MIDPVTIKKLDQQENLNSADFGEQKHFSSILGSIEDSSAFSYSLTINQQNLYYKVITPLSENFDQELQLGEFKADLWKKDVIELFIIEPKDSYDQKSRYQEFNFSPSGAYWTASFDGYRNKISDSEKPLQGIEIQKHISETSIEFLIKIPLSALINKGNFAQGSKINCAIIWGKDYKLYLSTARLDPNKPDYHNLAIWAEAVLT